MKKDPKAMGQRGSKKSKINSKSKSAEQKKVTDDIWNISRLPAENPNPVMQFTPEGEVLYANDSGKELLTYWKQALQQTLPSGLQKQLKEAFNSGTKQQIEF